MASVKYNQKSYTLEKENNRFIHRFGDGVFVYVCLRLCLGRRRKDVKAFKLFQVLFFKSYKLI